MEFIGTHLLPRRSMSSLQRKSLPSHREVPAVFFVSCACPRQEFNLTLFLFFAEVMYVLPPSCSFLERILQPFVDMIDSVLRCRCVVARIWHTNFLVAAKPHSPLFSFSPSHALLLGSLSVRLSAAPRSPSFHMSHLTCRFTRQLPEMCI